MITLWDYGKIRAQQLKYFLLAILENPALNWLEPRERTL